MTVRYLCCVFYLLLLIVLVACQSTANYRDPVRLDSDLQTDPGLFQVTLDNGFRYWIRSTNASGSNHTIHMRLIVFAGSVDEADNERGYTHLLEHVLFRAVEKDAGLNKLIREAGLSWGADVNAYTYEDRTEYRFAFNGEQIAVIPRALKFAALLLDEVTVLESHVRAEKPVIEAEWRARKARNSDSPGQYAIALLGDTRWLHRPPQGNLGDLRAASGASVQRFWDKHYQPRNAMLIVTGKVDPFELQTQIEEQFAGLTNRTATIEKYAGPNPLRSRPPIEVVAFTDDRALEPYVRGHVFIPMATVDDYRSFRARVLDELAIAMVVQAQTTQFAGDTRCAGFKSQTRVAAGRPRVFEFELIPLDAAHFTRCAELLQSSLIGIPRHLRDRRALKKLRADASGKVASVYSSLRRQTPEQMVDSLTQVALRGDMPMSPAFVNREFDAAIKSISDDDLVDRVVEILARPLLVAFGAPPYAVDALPDNASALAAIESARPVTIRSAAASGRFNHASVLTDASIESEDAGEDWTRWILSNGVTVVHYPSQDHKGLVAIKLIDAGGFVGVSDDTVNEARYLARYHNDVAIGQLAADEVTQRRRDKNMFLESTVSTHTHSVTGVVVQDRVDDLFDALASVFQPLVKTADTSGFVARSQYWLQSRETRGADIVWQQYWSRLVTGAPPVLTRGQSSLLTYDGLARAHHQLFQTASSPVVVVYGDVTSARVKARLIDTFGAIKKKEASTNGPVFRKRYSTANNLVVGGRGQTGALSDTVDVHMFQHCANSDDDYPQFVEASSVVARAMAGSVNSTIREQLGLTYAPSVSVDYPGKNSQITRYRIRITTGASDAARVRAELDTILGRIGNKGFSQQRISGVLNAINTKNQLDARYPLRRVSQIANKLYVGLTPSQAQRIKHAIAEDSAFDIVNEVARDCFGQRAGRPLTVTHRGTDS